MKVIIPTAGYGTRFLPFSKVLPKEFWPLADKPILHYIAQEAILAGMKELILVTRPGNNNFLNYFKKDKKLEKLLIDRKKTKALKEIREIDNLFKGILFSNVFQKKPLGDGHAVLMAKKLIKNQACAVMFCDDIVISKRPCIEQLSKVFKKYKSPVIALHRLPKEKISAYGVVKVKKIAKNLYEIKEIEEKPLSPSSNLAITGKYIITPEIFSFLEKLTLSNGEIKMSEAFNQMIKKGHRVLGYEYEGEWLECGDKINYLKSNIYLSLKKHSQSGLKLKRMWRNWNTR